METLHELAGHDPVKIEAYMRMPIWEYWTILDNKLASFEKQKHKTAMKKK